MDCKGNCEASDYDLILVNGTMCYILCSIVLVLIFRICGAKVCHQNEVSDVSKSLQYEQEMIQKAEEKCNVSMLSASVRNDSYCNQVFDGIMCWPPTESGSLSIQPCPSYMYSLLPNGNASRTCLRNGEWYVHPIFNKTWTNLSGCFDPTLKYNSPSVVPAIVKEHMRYIQILYDVGYSISLVSLLVAVSIMLYFRNLHCQRNTIHINMFVSFIFRSIICLIKDSYVIPEINSIYSTDENKNIQSFGQSVGCKIVYTFFYYILSTNFMWIFIEGIYMHTFVMSTKYNVSSSLYKTLLVFGWGTPSTFVIPWVIMRIKHENTLCWSTNDVDKGYYWIIKGPITVTVVINFIFFVNIMRVLYTKLTASHTRNPKRYRKLAKSTLILIPLFGVYYLAFIAVPVCMEPILEVIWLYTEMFFNSFQGFAVAILFCFMNEEVRREIRKVKRDHKLRRNSHISNRSTSRTVEQFFQSEHDNIMLGAEPKPANVHFELDEKSRIILEKTKHLFNDGNDRNLNTTVNGIYLNGENSNLVSINDTTIES